jgi:hypothetical protein
MKSIKKLWMPVLLGLLLVATMVGVASARPDARPLGQAWRVLTVGVDACIPEDSTINWDIDGYQLSCTSGVCQFHCPANFPAAGEQAVGAVNVKRFTMYVFDNDNNLNAQVDASLLKSYPPTGGWLAMAAVGPTAESPAIQTIMDTTIDNNPVYRTQSPYIKLTTRTSANLRTHGFFIHYTW